MRVIICGGRRYRFTEADKQWLTTFGITHVREGGADGADLCAHNWAERHHVPCQTYRAQWSRFGLGAGPRRNTNMREDLLADQAGDPNEEIAVIAFPGGPGAANMVRQAREAGIRVIKRVAEKPTPSQGRSEEGVAALLRGSDTNPNSEASIAQQREETQPQTTTPPESRHSPEARSHAAITQREYSTQGEQSL